jgi:hypothetical protein
MPRPNITATPTGNQEWKRESGCTEGPELDLEPLFPGVEGDVGQRAGRIMVWRGELCSSRVEAPAGDQRRGSLSSCAREHLSPQLVSHQQIDSINLTLTRLSAFAGEVCRRDGDGSSEALRSFQEPPR